MKRLVAVLVMSGTALAAAACSSGDTPAGDGSARPVVLIVVDALRADRLGTYGYEARPTSPNIDAWSERGVVFERAWATSPWTLPSFGSILTGRLPSAHAAGVEAVAGSDAEFEVVAARRFVTLPEGVRTIAATLAAEGFDTGAFVTNPFLDPSFGLGRGFDYYDHYDTSNSELRPATEVVDLALQWIDDRDGRPFFLMVHLFDPHLDYDAPDPFRGTFARETDERALPVRGLWPIRNRLEDMPDDEREFISAAYDEEIAYVDAEVGRLFAGLEERGILDDGAVLLTSDHGEELFEHDGFEHGHAMYEEVLRVPMILWGGDASPGRSGVPVSLIDVAPTVLAAAGVESTATSDLPGMSLLDVARQGAPADRPIIGERVLYGPESKSLVLWPLKVILRIDTGEARLFDLEADPGERNDLATQRPEDLERLITEVAEQLAAAEAMGVAPEAHIDEELLRRLRALGYIR